MNEFDLIAQFLKQPEPAGVRNLAPDDDCALIQIPPNRTLCLSVDATIAGRHVPEGTDGSRFAERAVRRALSDLAACGATPTGLLVSLTSVDLDPAWVQAFGQTVHRLCAQWQLTVLGGDVSRGPTAAHITVLGETPDGAALTRRGACPGDWIGVFGPDCGGARAYLEVLAGYPPDPVWESRYWFPEPQFALGESLRGVASACIDVSDGLVQDLMHVLLAAPVPVTASLDRDAIPLCSGLVEAFGADRALEWALTGGDDYVLLATLPAHHPVAERGRIIGTVVATPQCGVLLDGYPLPPRLMHGWDHSR